VEVGIHHACPRETPLFMASNMAVVSGKPASNLSRKRERLEFQPWDPPLCAYTGNHYEHPRSAVRGYYLPHFDLGN
jgi:hypothetical protein